MASAHDIERGFERIESAILDIELAPGNPGRLSAALEQLGLYGLNGQGPAVDELLRLLRQGEVSADPELVDALMALAEGIKRFLCLSAERLGNGAGPAPPPASTAPPPPVAAAPPPAAPQGPEAGGPAPPPPTPAAPPAAEAATIKVPSHRLDELMESVKSLLITNTMLAQHRFLLSDQARDLLGIILDQNRVTDAIRKQVLDIRRMSLRATFNRMGRLARELAQRVGKKVEMELHGGDLELDKTVVDDLGDPLLHMVRNAVDHGLETPADRAAAGKPETGRLRLAASHQGNSIVIELRDDGRGLDRERILAKAREKGLVGAGESLSAQETYALIMQPGFSTAEKVTDVSGRGVGMDVVARAIRALDGEMDIESAKGAGTCFTIRLPYNRGAVEGIAKGIVVEAGGTVFVIPSGVVREVVSPRPQDVVRAAEQGEIIHIRGKVYALHRMGDLCGLPSNGFAAEDGLVLLMEINRRRKALLVDRVHGEQQVVIRSFDRYAGLFDLRRFTGIALIGEKLGVAVDIESLLESA